MRGLLWPLTVWQHSAVRASHRRRVLSAEADSRPLEPRKSTLLTEPRWPRRVERHRSLWRSHTCRGRHP